MCEIFIILSMLPKFSKIPDKFQTLLKMFWWLMNIAKFPTNVLIISDVTLRSSKSRRDFVSCYLRLKRDIWHHSLDYFGWKLNSIFQVSQACEIVLYACDWCIRSAGMYKIQTLKSDDANNLSCVTFSTNQQLIKANCD